MTPLDGIWNPSSGTTNVKCDPTSTTVNGKPACRGEVIFLEEFSASSVDNLKWTVSNRICNAPVSTINLMNAPQMFANQYYRYFPTPHHESKMIQIFSRIGDLLSISLRTRLLKMDF